MSEEHEESKAVELREPRSQKELRQFAFAKQLLTVVNAGEAYRDVYEPLDDVSPKHHAAAARLLKDPYVGMWVGELAKHALADSGIDRSHAIKRLLETIDSDITDFADDGPAEIEIEEETFDLEGKKTGTKKIKREVHRGFMSLQDIRDKLPLEKRRLIRKYTERLKDGEIVSRSVELEPKQPAIELLSRIQKWVDPSQVNIVQKGNIVNVINNAHAKARRQMEALKPAIEGSVTASHISRSQVAQEKMLPVPAEPKK